MILYHITLKHQLSLRQTPEIRVFVMLNSSISPALKEVLICLTLHFLPSLSAFLSWSKPRDCCSLTNDSFILTLVWLPYDKVYTNHTTFWQHNLSILLLPLTPLISCSNFQPYYRLSLTPSAELTTVPMVSVSASCHKNKPRYTYIPGGHWYPFVIVFCLEFIQSSEHDL